MKLKCLNKLGLLLLCFSLSSCESISYYSQAILGQLSILSKRESIESIIADKQSSPELKAKLRTILDVRSFAESELQLPVEDNYESYVDIERPYVVWNVFATPEFSMSPVNWCYPIAGCVSYRGYFSEDSARRYANKLGRQEMDVYVGGVSAYSTLGWFSDPILSTIIDREDYQLASLLFHELAHQLIYIPGDTEFNESFATALEREGLRRWLLADHADQQTQAKIQLEAEQNTERREDFVNLIEQTILDLNLLYARDLSKPEKRKIKADIFLEMKGKYEILKASWDGYAAYDNWMQAELNNAQLNTVATYYNWVPAFEKILQENDYDLSLFYAEVRLLSELNHEQRSSTLSSKIN